MRASPFASQDEFPRVVLAPTTPESAFKLTVDAFNLADRLQTPVIILSDHHLASCYWTVDDLPAEEVTLDQGVLASKKELASGDRYLRYRLTDSGISPRAWPGQGTALVVSSGDEHDESGHITEEPGLRNAMVDKRWKKLELIDDPGLEADIQKGADTVLIGWGSTYGALREAVQRRREKGKKIPLVQLYRLWPFPGRELKKLDLAKTQARHLGVKKRNLLLTALALKPEMRQKCPETMSDPRGRTYLTNLIQGLKDHDYIEAIEILGLRPKPDWKP